MIYRRSRAASGTAACAKRNAAFAPTTPRGCKRAVMMRETTRDPSTPLERFCAEHALPPSARVLLEAYMSPPLDLDAIEIDLDTARLIDERLEGVRFADGDVGQNLAVDLDAGLVQAVDEAAVGEAFFTHGGVDALDPQGAEVALLNLAVAIGVLAGLLDRLARDANRILATAAIALRLV